MKNIYTYIRKDIYIYINIRPSSVLSVYVYKHMSIAMLISVLEFQVIFPTLEVSCEHQLSRERSPIAGWFKNGFPMTWIIWGHPCF